MQKSCVHSFLTNVYGVYAPRWPVTPPYVRQRHWWLLTKRDLRNLRWGCMKTQGLSRNESEAGAMQSQDQEYSGSERGKKAGVQEHATRTVIRVEALSQDMVQGRGLCSFLFLPSILCFPQMHPVLFLWLFKICLSFEIRLTSLSLSKALSANSKPQVLFLCLTWAVIHLCNSFRTKSCGVFWHLQKCCFKCLASPDQVVSSLKLGPDQ